jgi:hypothetical protein
VPDLRGFALSPQDEAGRVCSLDCCAGACWIKPGRSSPPISTTAAHFATGLMVPLPPTVTRLLPPGLPIRVFARPTIIGGAPHPWVSPTQPRRRIVQVACQAPLRAQADEQPQYAHEGTKSLNALWAHMGTSKLHGPRDRWGNPKGS